MQQLLLILLVFVFSCNVKHGNTNQPATDTTQEPVLADSLKTYSGKYSLNGNLVILCPWIVDFNKQTKSKNPAFKPAQMNADTIINGLNELHPGITLEKTKFSGDTLIMQIRDSEYLCERMGSYGALSYIADVVINLTSLKQINFVKIDFAEGSHLSPGTWSKKEYSNYKQIR